MPERTSTGPRGAVPSRVERAREARKLRDQNLTLREIAERMGVAVQTVHAWLADPDGSKLKARKNSYRGVCENCGGPTNGGNGPTQSPAYCWRCSRQRLAADQDAESREWIIRSLREFAAEYGRSPTSVDFGGIGTCSAETLAMAAAQREGRGWPDYRTVWNRFGGWEEALAAAGLEPVETTRVPSRLSHG